MLWTVIAAALLTEGYLPCGCQQPCFPLVLKEGWRTGPRGSCWHLLLWSHHLTLPGHPLGTSFLFSPARRLLSLGIGMPGCESWYGPASSNPFCYSQDLQQQSPQKDPARLLSSGALDTLSPCLPTAAGVPAEPQAPFVHKTRFLELALVLGSFHSPDLSFCHQPSKPLVSLWTKLPGNTACLLDHRLARMLVIVERVEFCRSRAL